MHVLESNFESGNDGWTLGDFFNNSFGAVPEYMNTGGVQGGYLQATDIYGYNSFHAPSSWLGNQSAIYGGLLHISERVASADGMVQPLVVLASGAMRLQYTTNPPTNEWQEFVVPLLASAGWEVGLGNGEASRPATEEELAAVLSDLTWLAINADWQTGDDLVGLDEVFVTTPEPSAILLTLSGLLALAFAAKRRH
jgi:hypothetical protein